MKLLGKRNMTPRISREKAAAWLRPYLLLDLPSVLMVLSFGPSQISPDGPSPVEPLDTKKLVEIAGRHRVPLSPKESRLVLAHTGSCQIASILELDEYPDEFWTDALWNQLRELVRSRLANESLPSLGLVK